MSGPLFDKYFKYVEKTEPPLIFHRWSLLSSLGAMLGRQFWIPHGEFNIFPNMYCMLIGDPGTRKSTAIKLSKKVLSGVGYDKFAAERTSKEKFLVDLEGVEGEDGKITKNGVMEELFGEGANASEPKEVFVVADEFNDFVGSGNLDFLSLLGSLWDWDDAINPYRQRLKTSRSVSIYQPTVSILSGNTHAGFNDAFPPAAIGQGFLSRLLLVFGEESGKRFTFPERPSPEIRQALIDYLLQIKETVHGPATVTEKAHGMLDTIYRTFGGLEDVRFKHYSTRRFTHLLKLCLLVCAANKRTQIGASDVLFANTLLTFTEHRMPQAMGEYGKAKNADVAARILTVLGDAKSPLQHAALWKQVSADLDRMEDLQKLLAGLAQAGKIQYVTGTKDNNVSGFMIVRKTLNNRALYVDYKLLPEATQR